MSWIEWLEKHRRSAAAIRAGRSPLRESRAVVLRRDRLSPNSFERVEALERRLLLSGAYYFDSIASLIPAPKGAYPSSSVVMNSSGDIFGTTTQGGAANDGTVFEIVHGTSVITTIASFNGANGLDPHAGLTIDTSGNLFGTTEDGGPGDGTVFEIVHGTTAITTIGAFNTVNGQIPLGGVTLDTSGNLFGTTEYGGANHDGAVFEILHGTTSVTLLASFNVTNGENPYGGVTIDTSGNIFGTTEAGGAIPADGEVFEIVHGTSTITPLAPFNGSNGAAPKAAMTLDSSGNLYGTTSSGGTNSVGTVFEIVRGATTVHTVASFNNAISGDPLASVIFDTSGNLFGTTNQGAGPSNPGTVFEIVHATTSITTLATFNGSNGSSPLAALTLDTSGNLFGTTSFSGPGGGGTLFEVLHGASAVTTVAPFNITNGDSSYAGLTLDTSGNLFGDTQNGGPSGEGTVFEILHGATTVTTIATFNTTNGAAPDDALTLDSSGNLFGTTGTGGANNDGTVFEIIHGTTSITTIASFNGTNGQYPHGSVTFDPLGNLFSTTYAGGTGGFGTVFEIPHGTTTIFSVASFNKTNGANPQAGLTMDSSGNLLGVTEAGGTNNDGAVFFIARGATSITPIASFNITNGFNPTAPLVIDSSGNLFGTASQGAGGSYLGGDGNVFEIVLGATTITTVAVFNNTNSGTPYGGLTIDTSGNLFGETENGGANTDGALYEVVHGTNAITTLASFNFANGYVPVSPLALDSSGDLFGDTESGGSAAAGAIFELTPVPPTLSFTAPPLSATTGATLDTPTGVQVSVDASWGNVVPGDSSQISLTLSTGVFSTGANTATATAVNGIATFGNLVIDAAGTYTLAASDGMYAPATSAPFSISLASHSVSGEVFNDASNSGTLDSGEVGQAVVTVTLTPTGATTGSPVSVATGADGYYMFTNVNAGTYSVSETLPAGYALTAPIGGSGAVTVTNGPGSAGPTFGNVLISSVILNFNMLVALSQDYTHPGTFANGDLDGSGTVDFSDLVLLSQNYTQTLPIGDYSVSVADAVSAHAVTEANVARSTAAVLSSVSGTVFNDVNGTSTRQSGESGLSGRKVYLEVEEKGTKGERTSVTDSKGNFSFSNVAAGNYVLIVATPAGWKSTTAAASGDHLTLKSGQKRSGLLFGQQVIPPFAVTSTRTTDPLDHTKDIVTFYARNNGVGSTAGTRDVLAVDAMLSSSSGLLIRTYDADGSGLLDDADFAGENTTPTASYIRVGGPMFFVAGTSPSAKTGKYHDMQLVKSFEVAGTLFGAGAAANTASGTRIAVAVVKKGSSVTLKGVLAAEKGKPVSFSVTAVTK